MRNFAPQAQADLDDAVGWHFDRGSNATAAERLLSAVLDAAALVSRRPQIGRIRRDLLPDAFRFWSIPRHRLILVYDSAAPSPKILRVLSTDQDLGPLLASLADMPDDDRPA